MGRPKGPPYTKINLAPPTDVVEQMDELARHLGMSKVALWEIAARRFLATFRQQAAKKPKEKK